MKERNIFEDGPPYCMVCSGFGYRYSQIERHPYSERTPCVACKGTGRGKDHSAWKKEENEQTI